MSIVLDHVKYSYGDGFCLDLNLQIPENTWTIIVGNNGAGKTTLLKLLAGVIKPNAGKILFKNEAPEIGYIFQNPDDQIIQLSIEKEMAFNLENRGVPIEEIKQKLDKFMTEYDFAGREEEPPNTLSGGEKQRLALAGTLISEPDILIFDEPTGFLDYMQKEKLYQRIIKLKKEGKTVLWVSHEIDELFLADQIIELQNGKIIFNGTRSEYLGNFFKQKEIIAHYLKNS